MTPAETRKLLALLNNFKMSGEKKAGQWREEFVAYVSELIVKIISLYSQDTAELPKDIAAFDETNVLLDKIITGKSEKE